MGSLVFQATLGGQVNLNGPNTASTFDIAVPATTGTMVTTGDSGTVTNTMLAASAYNTPGTIGSGTANSGAFTTLSASSTVSGAGFSTYLASPPAIGGTAAASGRFSSLTNTALTSGRVVYSTTNGLETDSANLLFDGTTLTASSITSKAATALTLQSAGVTAVTITTAQNVGVAQTVQTGTEKFGVTQSDAGSSAVRFYASSASYVNNIVEISCARSGATTEYNAFTVFDNNTTLKMLIRPNGNLLNANNSYGSLSDVNLKENIVDATPKLDGLMQVKVRNYNLKDDVNKTKQIGVIAQELETIFPGMIETDVDGIKAVKYSVFVPMLLKAIQEQQAIIISLTDRIAALEAK